MMKQLLRLMVVVVVVTSLFHGITRTLDTISKYQPSDARHILISTAQHESPSEAQSNNQDDQSTRTERDIEVAFLKGTDDDDLTSINVADEKGGSNANADANAVATVTHESPLEAQNNQDNTLTVRKATEDDDLMNMGDDKENSNAVPNANTTGSKDDDKDDISWQHYDANRTIAFVHVGKAGGLTIRHLTSLVCRMGNQDRTEEELAPCIDKYIASNATLARQVQYYFHMFQYKKEELEQATTYLVVLRHPIDRVISSYRYSHPANCRGELREADARPFGCHLEPIAQEPGTDVFQVYTRCFPSAGMEDFAQNVLSPYPSVFNISHLSDKPMAYQNETALLCRRLAHRMLRGFGPDHPNPHFYFNYNYYMDRTTRLYPNKELFGIRTEKEWEDLQALDLSLGGTGEFHQEGKLVSHGSEAYLPSPLTTKAYHKLCCVLEHEIANYQELLQRVQNLNDSDKQECMDKVREKCGIDPSMSLEEWRNECQAKIEHDRPVWMLPEQPPPMNVVQRAKKKAKEYQEFMRNITNANPFHKKRKYMP